MQKDPHLTRRNRLAGFDYANPGFYFLTACTDDRRPILGRIDESIVLLSSAGRVVEEALLATVAEIPTVTLDCYVIMPNHVHLLLYLALANEAHSISSLMKQFKGESAAVVRRRLLLDDGGSLWQKGFHDMIVRNDQQLEALRRYVADNPRKWHEDEYL